MKNLFSPQQPNFLRRSTLCISLFALWAIPAFAETTQATGESAADPLVLPEVVSTAQSIQSSSLKAQNTTGSRLGITALDTPATVQTITADSIELRGDTNIVDAVGHAAGIAALPTPGSGGYGFAARGFGSSSVTILYDGIKSLINTGSMTYPYDTWNVDRIEVLNGPASVLYGGGAIGAAINVIPRKPSAMSENTIRLSAGSFGTKGAAFDSTGAINDKLLYRVDVSQNSSDGYVQRGESSSSVVSAALTYLAADNLSFTLSADNADRHAMFYNGLPLINGVADESLRDINYSSYDTRIPFGDQRLTLLTEWQPAEGVKVRNVTYYIAGQRLWRYPAQFVYRPATNDILRKGFGTYKQHQNQVGNHTEANVNHPLFGLENSFSFGADIDRLVNKRLVDTYAGTDVLDLQNSSPGQFPAGAVTRNYQKSRASQYSLFAEDRLVVMPKLSLITGIRADHSAIERENLVTHTTVSKTYTPVSWRGGGVYEIAPKFNLYGQYSTAIDPVANLCCISAAQLGFAMSEGKQTEIGLKNVALDGRLEWSLAAYHITKDKLLTPDPNNLGLSIQVGQQSSRGIEAAVTLKPAKDWQIEANGTVLKAKYDDFSETVSGVLVSRNGNRPINIPQKLANLWVTWSFAPKWLALTGVEYGGDRYANTDNTQRLPAYTVLDAGLRWKATQTMTFDFRANNILDKFYAYTSVGNGSNGGQLVLGAPRSVDVVMTTNF